MSQKDDIRQLKEIVEHLQLQVTLMYEQYARIEAQSRAGYARGGVVLPEPPDILPRGRYEATIESVERRNSKTDKWYWSVQLGEVKGHPTKKLWVSLPEYIKSPVEQTCERFGIMLRRHDRKPPWFSDTTPYELEGQRCVVQVAISYYNGRRYNEVESISPLPR